MAFDSTGPGATIFVTRIKPIFASFVGDDTAITGGVTNANMSQFADFRRAYKQPVRVATAAALATNTRTGNVLTASANGTLAAIDGVTPVVGNRVLVKNEATSSNNGLYSVTSVGSGGTPWTMTRTNDAIGTTEVVCGIQCNVEEGTVNANTTYKLTTANPITVNTTSLTFAQPTQDAATLGGIAAASYRKKSDTPFFRVLVEGDLSQIGTTDLPTRLNPVLNQGAKTISKIVIYCPNSGTGTLTLDFLKKALPAGSEATLYTTNAGSKPSLTGTSGVAYLVITVTGSGANNLPSTVALADLDLLTPTITAVPNNAWYDLIIEFYE